MVDLLSDFHKVEVLVQNTCAGILAAVKAYLLLDEQRRQLDCEKEHFLFKT